MSSSPGIKSKIRFRLGGGGGSSSNNNCSSTPNTGGNLATYTVDQTVTSSAAGSHTNASRSARSTTAPSSSSTSSTGRTTNTAPTHSRNLTFNFSRSSRHSHSTGSQHHHHQHQPVITQSNVLTFVDFTDLFRAFAMHMRRDLRELFEQQSTVNHLSSIDQPCGVSEAPTGTQCSTFPSCRVNGTQSERRNFYRS